MEVDESIVTDKISINNTEVAQLITQELSCLMQDASSCNITIQGEDLDIQTTGVRVPICSNVILFKRYTFPEIYYIKC